PEAPGAAPPGMDLRFHHPERPAELLGHLLRLLRGIGDAAPRHGDPELLEQALRLMLMNVHRVALPRVSAAVIVAGAIAALSPNACRVMRKCLTIDQSGIPYTIYHAKRVTDTATLSAREARRCEFVSMARARSAAIWECSSPARERRSASSP